MVLVAALSVLQAIEKTPDRTASFAFAMEAFEPRNAALQFDPLNGFASVLQGLRLQGLVVDLCRVAILFVYLNYNIL